MPNVSASSAGGDCPGLNAAIRGVAKPAMSDFHIEVIGIEKGFRGLVENHARVLHLQDISGILSLGGTILGTSREKPHKMPLPNGETIDLTSRAVETYQRLGLDCLVCLGGNGTHKVAYNLTKHGLNVIGLPKTIDNDLAETDVTFGFNSAVTTAAEAIDRLYSTAEAHLRVMVIELMGHNAGWLALTAGVVALSAMAFVACSSSSSKDKTPTKSAATTPAAGATSVRRRRRLRPPRAAVASRRTWGRRTRPS